ncbi:adenine phosphoribosyltransferase [Novosphingobium aromaticivorans DSM 12444]|uniref:Adenine phosphoribosyltransferase n=1 Tax=Novosphingobium aromaticivorans (strain ATCC 700278 / DSM 12444 / CCUG 56034 / CIP 105152 / NBRC 16084 / F199) TaxID=279238 RepID=APT_NOVAD|nr:adenine phosphoribosyltransferase [Novosphingobium aromaticivorans]Q2GAK1.1 RecName: Full=Adenine phosphoribosyltransferase; Short=APRT [Novosphingobium aromaticivorans DSM 12444]ABD25122.1 adenine phosphoribosyltransferase [Novosphingobium aromaticivorans DSM 12444]SCX84165.1 adenine phosphoribosyltransferase [Novosphingobium aromaticivorans]
MTTDDLKRLVRTVPDFPSPGILFRDITTLIAHGEGLSACIDHLAHKARAAGAQAVAGMEARGFIFGAAVAARMGLGFIPVRKPGKLPVKTIGIDYALEYGRDRLEIDPTAIREGQRVVIVDDLIATGGTALAAAELLRMAGAHVTHALFVIDLPELHGAERLRGAGLTVEALMDFPGH